MKESTFEGVGGLKIFTRSWQPEGKTRGVVVIVPGFNSHSGQYLWVGEQFAAKDLAAYAIDLRGRGRSEGERYYVEEMEDYTDDVAALIRTAKSENPGLPVFLLGHSAGGYCQVNWPKGLIDQLVLHTARMRTVSLYHRNRCPAEFAGRASTWSPRDD